MYKNKYYKYKKKYLILKYGGSSFDNDNDNDNDIDNDDNNDIDNDDNNNIISSDDDNDNNIISSDNDNILEINTDLNNNTGLNVNNNFNDNYITIPSEEETELDNGIILYMFLGGLPTEINIWESHFDNESSKNVKIVVHSKDNPSNTTSLFTKYNIEVSHLNNDEHLRTKWAGLSLVNAALLLFQHGIQKYKVSNVVFLPYDGLPLYTFNTVKNILKKFKKSLFCNPFFNADFNEFKNNTLKSERKKIKIGGGLCSQWFIINNRDFKYYFHNETLNNKIPTYIKHPLDSNDEDILILNKNLKFDENFWYLKYLKVIKKNINTYSNVPILIGGAFDENFFCRLFIMDDSKYINISVDSYKKIINKFNSQIILKNINTNFYSNFNKNSLYKIEFTNKLNNQKYIINTYHYIDEEIYKTSCPVAVFHNLSPVDVTSKLLSTWVNSNKISTINTGHFIKINEIINLILNTKQTNNIASYYLDIIEKINVVFLDIQNKSNESLLLYENNKVFIKITERDHPLLFIVETFGMCLCTYLLVSLFKLINIINKTDKYDRIFITENDYNEIPNSIKYLFVWNNIVYSNFVKYLPKKINKYELFPNKDLNITENIKIIENLILYSKNILNHEEIYNEYYVCIPNFTKNYLISSTNQGSLFIRKIQIQKNIKITDLPENHIIKELLNIQYNTFTNLLNNNNFNPLNTLFDKFNYTINKIETVKYINSTDKEYIKSLILSNNLDQLFNNNINIYNLINLSNNIISIPERNDLKFIKDTNDELYNILNDFMNNYIISSEIKIEILKYIINIFDILFDEYNKKYNLEKPIILVLKGGLLMYNSLLEIFELLPKKITSVLLERYNNNIYSYDLDFSIKIDTKLSKNEYDIHYNNCKKIMIYASFLINSFITKNLNLEISKEKILLLYNNINIKMVSSIKYNNMELLRIDVYNTNFYSNQLYNNIQIPKLNDYTNGIFITKNLEKKFIYVINSELINNILNSTTQQEIYKLAILYNDTNNWNSCNNPDTQVINTTVNLFVPIKLTFRNIKTNQIEVKYFKEAIVDIALESYESGENKMIDKNIVKYNYFAEKLSFNGYDFKTLLKIIEYLLFYNCVDEKTLTLNIIKHKKKSKVLSILYLMDIILYWEKKKSNNENINITFISNDISYIINQINYIKNNINDIINSNTLINLKLDKMRNSRINNYAIYNLFNFILKNVKNINFSQNFNNLFYFLNILLDEFMFLKHIIDNNNIFDNSIDIYNSDFIKYKKNIKL